MWTDKIAELTAIGEVRNRVKEPRSEGWGGVVSDIVIYEAFREAVQGLEDFSHLIVLFWMHLVGQDGRDLRKVRLRLGGGREIELGVLATRSQSRPNPIGVSVVKLLDSREGTLRVEGLDAIDGTPVLDIKPYLPPYDSFPKATVPAWATGG